MTRTLITGGAGFIGLQLARLLVERGLDVDLVDDCSRGTEDAALLSLVNARLIRRDLRVEGALDDLGREYAYVFHLAAIVGVSRVVSRPYAVLDDNVMMLRTAISAARRQRALERLVFLSTSEVYAGTLASFTLPLPTPESTPLTVAPLAEPRSAYMLSKIYGEAMCLHAGVPVTILRPHNIYGPRMGLAHVIPELLQRAHAAGAGEALEVASVDHRRTFCFVDDAVEMIWRAASSPSGRGATLNLGAPGPEVSIGELARLIVRTVGKRIEIVALPPTPGSPLRRRPDITRTVALTGYEPRVALTTGVRLTYDWYREHVFDRVARAPLRAANRELTGGATGAQRR